MDKLTKYQRDIVTECVHKKSGCMVLPMGTGKTVIALVLSQQFPERGKTLIVMAKTLIQNWIAEIDKFFGDELPYEIFHKDYLSDREYENFTPSTRLVLTTPDITSLIFKKLNLRHKFEPESGVYESPKRPILGVGEKPGSFLYSTKWKCLIIDEIQSYTSIKTAKCASLASIYAIHRWALSGTPINEPQIRRVMGYYALIGEDIPETIPEMKKLCKSPNFPGLNASRVVRVRDTADFTLPPVECFVKTHQLSPAELLVYDLCKETIQIARLNNIIGYSLPTILFLRQFLVTPVLAFDGILNYSDTKNFKNSLNKTAVNKLVKTDAWKTEPSSRIKSVISVVNSHPSEKIVLFNCFKTSLYAIQSLLVNSRECFVLDSKLSASQRATVFQSFQRSKAGVLFLTYALGAEGLNLQHAHVVLLVDVWWNDAVVQQAITRILRRGQLHKVYVYFFTSNTGLEKGLFDKHAEKNKLLKQIAIGPQTLAIKKISMNDIILLLNLRETAGLAKKSCPL
jgi:SNF2 family DNA or RNA helicase